MSISMLLYFLGNSLTTESFTQVDKSFSQIRVKNFLITHHKVRNGCA